VPEIDVGIYSEGPVCDFSMVFGTPLVSRRLGELLDDFAPGEVERIPARFQTNHGNFELLHILWEVDCLDRERSEISQDGMIWKTVLDSKRLPKRQIIRLAGNIRIVVTRELKEAIESKGFTGAIFEPVETS
jgi:hypothetical protein